MRYIKLFEKFKVDKESIIIPKGTILFHGTVEEYDYKNIRVGSYDKIFWTSTSSKIAQMYIPVSGSKIFTNSNSLTKPSRDTTIVDIQKELGIEFIDIEFDKYGNVISYKAPKIFEESSKLVDKLNKELDELYKDYIEKEKLAKESMDRDILHEYLEAKQLYKDFLEKTYKERNYEYHRNQIVNKLLSRYNYKPDVTDDYLFNHSYKLKVSGNKLLKADESIMGKLIIIECLKDLKLYNISTGEGDLTDLQYHKIHLFRTIEEKGYDGIVIDDFAQSEVEGNFGHLSYGFFQSTIDNKYIRVKDVIDAKHPREWKYGDNVSEEYKEYLKSK